MTFVYKSDVGYSLLLEEKAVQDENIP